MTYSQYEDLTSFDSIYPIVAQVELNFIDSFQKAT